MVVGLAVGLAAAGCDRSVSGDAGLLETELIDDDQPTTATVEPAVAKVTEIFEEPQQLALPEVQLSEQGLKSCLVGVGDAFPALALGDLEGEEQTLEALRGEKLTVVVLAKTGDLYSEEPLGYLGPAVVQKHAGRGVKAVAVHVGGAAEEAAATVGELGAGGYPHLHDPEGAALGKVATETLPRIYLLDAGGKIAWFDIEFSVSTQRDLQLAIEFLLSQK